MLPEPARLLAFVAASITLVVVPGPNLIYILTHSVAQGRRAGLVSAAGVETATLLHVTAAALGLSSLVARSPVVLTAVQYAGAAYLVHLAVRTLRRADAPEGQDAPARVRLGRIYRDGVVVNALNPKVTLFFLAFLPQFVAPGTPAVSVRSQMLMLGAIFFTLALILDIGYALAGGLVTRWLRRRSATQPWPRFLVAGVYVALAVYAAASGVGQIT